MKNKKMIYLLAALFAIALTVTYSNHFHNSFHFDDSHVVVNNIYIKSLHNIPLFFSDARTISSLPSNQAYRPIVVTSLALDYFLGKGLNTFYFHLSTFILFIVQGIFMYLLYVRIFDRSEENGWNNLVAFLAVAWYMLHPANAETINYITARSDSISTLFVVISLVMFIYSPVCRRWCLYFIPFALGMLTKPITATFVLLLFAYLLLFDEKSPSRLNAPAITLALKKTAPAFLFCLLLTFFINQMTPPTFAPGGAPFFNYVITQPYVILHYFTTFVLPLSLSADSDWGVLASMADFRFFAGISFIAVSLFTVVITSKNRKTRPIAFGILWFLITLLPTSLFPLAEVMNDHRVFLPYVGLIISASWSINIMVDTLKRAFFSKKRFYGPAIAVIIIVLSAYAYGTHERNKVWNTDETLWYDVTEKSPRNSRGLMNYGLALMAKGDFAGAESYYVRALTLTPNYPYLNINMGIVKEATGKTAEAEQYFKNAISFGPSYPECYFYYARFLRNHGRLDEAVRNLNKTLELSAAHIDARYMLMSIYFELNDFERLRELARQKLSIVPNDKQATLYLNAINSGNPQFEIIKESSSASQTPERLLNLSLRYYEAKQFEKSIDAAKEALKLRPDYDLAYNNICAAYNALGQWDKAIEAGEKAIRLNPNNQLAKNNLAWSKKQKVSGKKSVPR